MMEVLSNDCIISEGASRGNQHKFYKNGYWVKIDNPYCFEDLAEDFVSKFESCIVDFPYVEYKADIILYNEDEYTGCYSYNTYNRNDIVFMSLRHLFKLYNIPLSIITRSENIRDNIVSVNKALLNLTGLNLLGYFGRLLMLDCLIINEDRHIMNLGVVYCSSDSKFYEAPCFDNGSSLFCTNWTYRKRKSLEENIKFAGSVARPFSKFYDKQLDALLSLGCSPLSISKSKVDMLLSDYYNSLYSTELNKRVKAVLSNRLAYYHGRAFVWES